MGWIIALCSIAIAGLDWLAIGRFMDRRSRLFKGVIGVLWVIDLSPQIFSLGCFLFTSDNPTIVYQISGWISFLYMVLAVSHAPLSLSLVVSRRRWAWWLGGATMVAAIGIFLYSLIVTRTDYEVRKVVIESDRLPQHFDGYRIVQLSDFHIGTMLNPEAELSQIAEISNSLRPDIVAFTGDIINIRYSEIEEPIAKVLCKIESRDGVFTVMGNHDLGGYIKDSISLPQEVNTARLISRQEELGWRVLDNKTSYICRDGDSIAITGISFPKILHEDRHSSKMPDIGLEKIYSDVENDCFNITLCHIPQLWDDILATHKVDLTLAGHVHAMQMALQIGDMRISPSRIQYRRWSGLYEQQGSYLYINDGIGYIMYPMRIGARPEITLFELRKAK